jgi:hypothetical protein
MPTALISYRVLYSKTNRAKQLEGLFRAWNWLLSRATPRLAYAKHSECPFWYGERCQVGWLALAAHRVGWVPLQEPNVSRKGKGAGRGDLSAIKGYRKNAKYYDFEAKFANLDLSTLKPKKSFIMSMVSGRNFNRLLIRRGAKRLTIRAMSELDLYLSCFTLGRGLRSPINSTYSTTSRHLARQKRRSFARRQTLLPCIWLATPP